MLTCYTIGRENHILLLCIKKMRRKLSELWLLLHNTSIHRILSLALRFGEQEKTGNEKWLWFISSFSFTNKNCRKKSQRGHDATRQRQENTTDLHSTFPKISRPREGPFILIFRGLNLWTLWHEHDSALDFLSKHFLF